VELRQPARNNYGGYQNASLYKIDHPCRVSLPATVSDRGWSYAHLGFLGKWKRFLTSGLFANGASLSIIFGHRPSTIPRAFFLLETFFGPLSWPDLNS
jgi:hypothetical protein